MSTTADASPAKASDGREELILVSELAHQMKKHPVTIKRLLPPELVVYVGRTPWAFAARSRAVLLSARGRRASPT
jgi:hypothetical protein